MWVQAQRESDAPPATAMQNVCVTASSACINVSGTPIEYTSARHVTDVAHTNLPPRSRDAELARAGAGARVRITFYDEAMARAIA